MISRVSGVIRNSKVDDANSVFIFLDDARAILLKQMIAAFVSTPNPRSAPYKSNFFPVKGEESSGEIDVAPSSAERTTSVEVVLGPDDSGLELASRLLEDDTRPGN